MRRLHAAQRGVARLLCLATGFGLAACGNIQVRPLATGVVEQPAYQLSGSSLSALRTEAQRLCPNGAEVLRHAQRIDDGHDSAQAERWYGRWWQQTRSTLAPANQEAQLVVLCQPVPGSSVLAKAPDPVLAAEAAKKAAGPNASSVNKPPSLAPVGEGDLRDGMSAALTTSAVRSADGLRAATESLVSKLGGSKAQGDNAPRAATGSAAAKATRAASAPVLSY